MSAATTPAMTARRAPVTAALTGTATLLRLMLRRDRRRLPAWVLGIAIFVPYFFTAFRTIFPDKQALLAAAAFTEGPILGLLGGPGYGLGDDITHHTFFAAVYVLYFLLAAAFMNILLVSRHTRVEEQTGRSELVRANVVGRHAPLSAALLVAVIADIALALVLTAALIAFDAPLGSALLLGCSIAAVGLVFAGIAAVTAQLSEYSRVASAMAGAVLGATFVIRATGDLIGEHGSPLSWLSPFAWSQQTRVFVDERWWPLAISLLVAAAAASVGYALSTRRDVGAGLRATRPGPRHAPAWLRSPAALAWRLQRPGIRGWIVGLIVAGLVYGGTTQAVLDSFVDMTPELTAVLGGEEDPLSGYLALMIGLMVVATAVYTVLAMQRTRSEETEGRAEAVLATATSKSGWAAGHVLAVALGAFAVLMAASVATGVGAAAVTGEAGHILRLLGAGLAAYPAVLVVVGIAALLYGLNPRALTLAWVVVVIGGILEFFGPLLGPPQWLANLSPWEHTPSLPAEPFALLPVVVQTLVALAAAGVGLWAFGRRDLTAT